MSARRGGWSSGSPERFSDLISGRAFATLADTLALYQASALATRQGTLRNAAPQLAGIALRSRDVETLAAFLRSLNEDYN